MTITQATFPRLAAWIDSLSIPLQTSATLPTHGAFQTWDYSSWTLDYISTSLHIDATTAPNFPRALHKVSENLVFANLPITSDAYYGLDANGWYPLGRSYQAANYSLTAVSGGANDSIHFLNDNQIYGGRTDLCPFPLTYQTQRSQSHTESIPFQVTIVAFGLNRTPGFRRRTVSRDLEVVGHGTLRMPTATGTASAPYNVLLVKINRTRVDSFFLGGAPAPAALLSALGLAQGATITDSFYNFYAPNYGANILGMTDNNGIGDILFYRTGALDVVLSLTNIQVQSSNCFPNPVQEQQTLTIETNKTIGSAYLNIVDASGRVVFKKNLEAIQSKQYQWKLPSILEKGVYFYQLIDQTARHSTQGTFQIN
ncbi:MAG: T9SS type A sorting domain-containing protein [Aureispira sp.]